MERYNFVMVDDKSIDFTDINVGDYVTFVTSSKTLGKGKVIGIVGKYDGNSVKISYKIENRDVKYGFTTIEDVEKECLDVKKYQSQITTNTISNFSTDKLKEVLEKKKQVMKSLKSFWSLL